MRMIHAAVLVTVVPVADVMLLQAVDMIELQAEGVIELQAVDLIKLQGVNMTLPQAVDMIKPQGVDMTLPLAVNMTRLQAVDAISLLVEHVIQPRVDREEGVRLTACRIKCTLGYRTTGFICI